MAKKTERPPESERPPRPSEAHDWHDHNKQWYIPVRMGPPEDAPPKKEAPSEGGDE